MPRLVGTRECEHQQYAESAGCSSIEPDAAPGTKAEARGENGGGFGCDNSKTETERWLPVHAAIAPLLADWRRSGWAATFGQAPEPGDLVLPTPPEPKRKGRVRALGSMLDKSWIWKRLRQDCIKLGVPTGRRVHDLRRTGVSLAIEDGADEGILKRATHARPRHVMGLYTSVQWAALCREVGKLRFGPPSVPDVTGRGRGTDEWPQ